jgi:hypothetical protein
MQATVAPAPPVPDQPPTPATAPGSSPTSITITGPDGNTQTIAIPQTRSELRAIESARNSISNQIQSAMGRRRDVASELRRATDPVDRQGLEHRLTVLDTRIAQLENELAVTGKQVTMAPSFAGNTRGPDNMDPDVVVPIVSVVTMFVIFPIVFVKARNMWRHGSTTTAPAVAQLSADTTQRLERLEAGVEAIAIEVERISEGQRFVTKLLSEAAPSSRIPTLAAAETVASTK